MRENFRKLQDEYEQIIQNQLNRFEPGMTVEQFKAACDNAVTNLRNLRISTEKSLKEFLYPILEKIESISNEDEAELYNAAQKLSSFETRQDPGLALKIYQALLKRARTEKNDAATLKYLYWCGITQFFFYGHRSEIALTYFEEGMSYEDRYHSFEDPEIRQYVHRCLGNMCMSFYAVNEPQKALEREEANFAFWNKLKFFGKDLDFPWLNYFLNGLNHRRSYLAKHVTDDPESASKEDLNKLLDVSMTINKLYHKNTEYYSAFGGTRYDYHLWEAQFLSGLISFDNLVENIEKKQTGIAPDDYSPDAMYTRLQLNSSLMFYVSKLSKLKDRKDEVFAKLAKKTIEYFSSIPRTADPDHINVYLRMLASEISDVFNPAEQLDFILKMTTYRHIPTHAHSIMVGKIAVLLTKQLIDKNPAAFIGYPGITREEDVHSRTEELCEFAEMSGLCHDIGKIACVDNPYMHIRVLTEDEYEIIKKHPNEGVLMLARSDNDTSNQGYIDVIAGHHKYHNNSSGYPEDVDITKSKHRIFVDIIAVANSIVAATDNMSKLYTNVKSLKDVCNEIKQEADYRYSPVVAGLLYDETILSSIQSLLDDESINAYYTAYLYAWSGGDQE